MHEYKLIIKLIKQFLRSEGIAENDEIMKAVENLKVADFKRQKNKLPKRFDSSKINSEDKQILIDFARRREIFNEYIKKNNLNLFTCPSCGYPTLTERNYYEICSICHWEDDGQDEERANEIWGGPNGTFSLTENRLVIGRILRELTEKTGGKINLNPEKVIKIIKDRDVKIAAFRTAHYRVPGRDVIEKQQALEKETLADLIEV